MLFWRIKLEVPLCDILLSSGFPPFAAPDFQPDNKTVLETIDGFGAGLVLVPVIGLFEMIVVAKAFSHKFNYVVDPTQEFIALGICNIMGSFVSSFPVGGAFSRSAILAESGSRTPLSGIITGKEKLSKSSIIISFWNNTLVE